MKTRIKTKVRDNMNMFARNCKNKQQNKNNNTDNNEPRKQPQRHLN